MKDAMHLQNMGLLIYIEDLGAWQGAGLLPEIYLLTTEFCMV